MVILNHLAQDGSATTEEERKSLWVSQAEGLARNFLRR